MKNFASKNHGICSRAVLLCLVAAFAFAATPTLAGTGQADNVNRTVIDVTSGQTVVHVPGAIEGIGAPAGTQDVNLSAHGWQRLVDNNDGSKKFFIPFATSNELAKFVQSDTANQFYFDFIRAADVVSVDFTGGVSNPANLVAGQTTTVDVPTPAGRLDTRNDALFDSTRILRFSTVTLNMERNDCRHPIDYTTGLERTDLPANICLLHSWHETPSLVLTYKPTVTYQAIDRVDPARAPLALYARDFNSTITGHTWVATWEAPTGDPVPPVQYPPVGEPCAPTAHGNHAWLPLSSGNSEVLTGGAAGAAPNSCTYGVQSATRTWNTEQDAVCFDSQYYRQSGTREVNVNYSNVVCNDPPSCGAGQAVTPSGSCVSLAGTASVPQNVSGAHFWPFFTADGTVRSAEGTAMLMCARAGSGKLFDFAGWAYGKKKPGKGCGKSDTDHHNYAFTGDKNNFASVLNQGNYYENWGKGSDTNCMGWMQTALCAGYNYLVPSVTTVVENTADESAATPPAGMPVCPGDLNLVGGAWKTNATYFATALQGTGSSGSHETVLASSLLPGDYPITALAKQQLNCYQRLDYATPHYDYGAPADQWTTTTECYYDYYGPICYDVSIPPITGYDHTYSLYTVTTALTCNEQNVTVATGATISDCNGSGYDGPQYATYTTSQGNVCGNDTAASYYCVPTPPDPCEINPWLCYDPYGFYSLY